MVKVGCLQSKESGKYSVLLRKAAAYLVTNKGNIQAGALHGLFLQPLPILFWIMLSSAEICLSQSFCLFPNSDSLGL